MRPSAEKIDELELELPALDGDEEAHTLVLDGDLADDAFRSTLENDKVEDALDDRTGEDGPLDEIAVDGAEGGWLLDAEAAGTLDVGVFDVALDAEGTVLDRDEPESRQGLEDLIADDEVVVADGGEEGPLADDEELREEDLPALDADDDGDVPDDALYDRGILGSDELRWDDRAWARAAELGAITDEPDDSAVLAPLCEDRALAARDAAWKTLEDGGRVMAACFVPGESVVVAIATADRARAMLVRVQPDGEARIIVEIDPGAVSSQNPIAFEDDGEACLVASLRWDVASGCLIVSGSFGVEAYKPA